jgi:two-component system, NtrC family, sensor histidine kinase PilS
MGRTERMLRWLYTGRLVVATAIFIAALARWLAPGPTQIETLIATVALLSALAVTAFGLWWVEVLKRPPGRNFLYAQVVYDVILVTAIIHVTGGPYSPYPPLYILVITAGALLLPLPGGMKTTPAMKRMLDSAPMSMPPGSGSSSAPAVMTRM